MWGFLVPFLIKEKVPEALIVLKKDLSEQVTQKIGLEKEHMPTKKEASKVIRIVCTF